MDRVCLADFIRLRKKLSVMQPGPGFQSKQITRLAFSFQLFLKQINTLLVCELSVITVQKKKKKEKKTAAWEYVNTKS